MVELFRMNLRSVILILLIGVFTCLISFSSPSAQGQQEAEAKPVGSITGLVKVDGKPGAGVVIELLKTNLGSSHVTSVTKVTTSKAGRYVITNILPGDYYVAPAAPPLVVGLNQRINARVEPGETVRFRDFDLVSKGSITGRVSNADGQAVAGETVEILLTGENGYSRKLFTYDGTNSLHTDEQGRYHISGVPRGRYLVSVGIPYGVAALREVGTKRAYYRQTFHPNATDPLQAVAVEVESGVETLDADITVGRPQKTYEIAGELVDAETGKPVPNARLCLITNSAQSSTKWSCDSSVDFSSNWPVDTGGFRIKAAFPGHYILYAAGGAGGESHAASNSYGEPLEFDIKDKDVTGLKIYRHRAAMISGFVTIETPGLASSDELSTLGIYASTLSESPMTSGTVSSRIGPDGKFRISGIRPGKVSLVLHDSFYPHGPKLKILRIERHGEELRGDLILHRAEELSDLRIVLGVGDSVLRGNVRIEGGSLEGVQLYVLYRLTNSAPNQYFRANLDAPGHFVIEGLVSGEYELMIGPMSVFVSGEWGSRTMSRMPTVKQVVTVGPTADSDVTLVLALKPQ